MLDPWYVNDMSQWKQYTISVFFILPSPNNLNPKGSCNQPDIGIYLITRFFSVPSSFVTIASRLLVHLLMLSRKLNFKLYNS